MHGTQCIRCGLLLQMSHVAWSVCSSYWCTVQNGWTIELSFGGAWLKWAQETMHQIGIEIPTGMGIFESYPVHLKALGAAAVYQQRNHLGLNNGTTWDAAFRQKSSTTCFQFFLLWFRAVDRLTTYKLATSQPFSLRCAFLCNIIWSIILISAHREYGSSRTQTEHAAKFHLSWCLRAQFELQ